MAKKKKNPANKLSIEKDFADLFKHIQDQNFENADDLENFLNQTTGKRIDEIVPSKSGKKSKEEQAHELLVEAYDSSPAEGRPLADKAIKLDPDNADAYVYLAETEEDVYQAMKFFSRGVAAGKRAIGKKEFKELKGHFWMAHETRPFMRAKAGLASCLYLIEEYDTAIDHFQEMMELNPNDNQGIRYQLAVMLVEQNKEKEFLKLYKEYDDDGTALWKYNYALYLFKKQGKSLKSNQALKKAYKANSVVMEFLTGRKELPNYLPQYITLGDESEAIHCINDSGTVWLKTEGALDWVNDFYEQQ